MGSTCTPAIFWRGLLLSRFTAHRPGLRATHSLCVSARRIVDCPPRVWISSTKPMSTKDRIAFLMLFSSASKYSSI